MNYHYSAPFIEYPVKRSLFVFYLTLIWFCFMGLILLFWFLRSNVHFGILCFSLLVYAASFYIILNDFYYHSPTGFLIWDEKNWVWQSQIDHKNHLNMKNKINQIKNSHNNPKAKILKLEILFDFQTIILLRIQYIENQQKPLNQTNQTNQINQINKANKVNSSFSLKTKYIWLEEKNTINTENWHTLRCAVYAF